MNIAVSLLDCLYLYATNDITQKDWNAIMYIVSDHVSLVFVGCCCCCCCCCCS